MKTFFIQITLAFSALFQPVATATPNWGEHLSIYYYSIADHFILPNKVEIENLSYLFPAVDANFSQILHYGPETLSERAAQFYLHSNPVERDTLAQISIMNWVTNVALAYEMNLLKSKFFNDFEPVFSLPQTSLNQVLNELKYGFFYELSTRDPAHIMESHRLNLCTAITVLGAIDEVSVPEILNRECEKRLAAEALSILVVNSTLLEAAFQPEWSEVSNIFGDRMGPIIFLKHLSQRLDDIETSTSQGMERTLQIDALRYRGQIYYRIEDGKFMKSLFINLKSEFFRIRWENLSTIQKESISSFAGHYKWLSQID